MTKNILDLNCGFLGYILYGIYFADYYYQLMLFILYQYKNGNYVMIFKLEKKRNGD